MPKRKLPLDPFDGETLLDGDIVTGQAALGCALMGLVAAALLVTSASMGWIRFVAAGMVLAGAVWIARRLWHSI